MTEPVQSCRVLTHTPASPPSGFRSEMSSGCKPSGQVPECSSRVLSIPAGNKNLSNRASRRSASTEAEGAFPGPGQRRSRDGLPRQRAGELSHSCSCQLPRQPHPPPARTAPLVRAGCPPDILGQKPECRLLELGLNGGSALRPSQSGSFCSCSGRAGQLLSIRNATFRCNPLHLFKLFPSVSNQLQAIAENTSNTEKGAGRLCPALTRNWV